MSTSSLKIDESGPPELIAERFASIDNDWRTQAAVFASCTSSPQAQDAQCQKIPKDFQSACVLVAKSFADRGGDRPGTQSFMNSLCSQSALATGLQNSNCHSFATAVVGAIVPGKFLANEMCFAFWTKLLATSRQTLDEAQAEDEQARTLQKEQQQQTRQHQQQEEQQQEQQEEQQVATTVAHATSVAQGAHQQQQQAVDASKAVKAVADATSAAQGVQQQQQAADASKADEESDADEEDEDGGDDEDDSED